MKVMCCREPAHVREIYVPFFFLVLPLLFRLRLYGVVYTKYYVVRKANRQQLIGIFPSTGDTQPCDGPPSRLYNF